MLSMQTSLVFEGTNKTKPKYHLSLEKVARETSFSVNNENCATTIFI